MMMMTKINNFSIQIHVSNSKMYFTREAIKSLCGDLLMTTPGVKLMFLTEHIMCVKTRFFLDDDMENKDFGELLGDYKSYCFCKELPDNDIWYTTAIQGINFLSCIDKMYEVVNQMRTTPLKESKSD